MRVNASSTFIQFTLNGRSLRAQPGQTILDLCRKCDIRVPTLCWSERLTALGGCRLCLVEMDGSVVSSCTTRPVPGTVIQTETPRLHRLRRSILELILSTYPIGELAADSTQAQPLRDLAAEYHVRLDRYTRPLPPSTPDWHHPHISMDHECCVMCFRCIQACGEEAQQFVLGTRGRGFETTISAGGNTDIIGAGCVTCSACVIECPTGALQESTILKRLRGMTLTAAERSRLERLRQKCHPDFPLVLAIKPEGCAATPVIANGSTPCWTGIHPQLAQKLGIQEHDAVEISTPYGTLRAHAVLSALVAFESLLLPWSASLFESEKTLPECMKGQAGFTACRLRRLTSAEASLPNDTAFELRLGTNA